RPPRPHTEASGQRVLGVLPRLQRQTALEPAGQLQPIAGVGPDAAVQLPVRQLDALEVAGPIRLPLVLHRELLDAPDAVAGGDRHVIGLGHYVSSSSLSNDRRNSP